MWGWEGLNNKICGLLFFQFFSYSKYLVFRKGFICRFDTKLAMDDTSLFDNATSSNSNDITNNVNFTGTAKSRNDSYNCDVANCDEANNMDGISGEDIVFHDDEDDVDVGDNDSNCLLYTSPSPRDS